LGCHLKARSGQNCKRLASAVWTGLTLAPPTGAVFALVDDRRLRRGATVAHTIEPNLLSPVCLTCCGPGLRRVAADRFRIHFST
jgi:hypothetical protein